MIRGEDRELFARTLRHAVETHTGTALDTALGDVGWTEALADDRPVAVATLFALQGEANATSSALDLVVAGALGLALDPAAAIVLPAVGRWDAPGAIDRDVVRVDGLLASAVPAADLASLVVVASGGEKDVVITVPAAALTVAPVDGIDRRLGQRTVSSGIDGVRLPAAPEVAAGSWTDAVAVARLAVAHELIGTSRRMLALAGEHAVERVQFGRPISAFQAVRHRLAETLVAIEMADAAVDAAWLDGSPGAALLAKGLAGRQARVVARHCQQVLAGIGFTTEHPFHRSVLRSFALDGLLGTGATLTAELGRQVLARGALPPLLPL